VKKAIILVTLATALAAGAAMASTNDRATTAASKDCTALKAKIGGAAFAQAYSTFGRCVSTFAQLEQSNTASAQAACTAEQADPDFATSHGGKTFAQFYGVGKTNKDAFGKCVSRKEQASQQAEQQGRLNPAQTCRASRTQMGTSAFTLLYGKNANDRNAYGKCVSKVAAAQASNEQTAAASCRTEQSDTAFAPAHGGKTFAQAYGTNADLSNAFGKCVVQKAQAASSSQQQATVRAAKACQGELTSSGAAAFRTKYGTFGHCVSLKASGK
jgi:hypothetical protein